MDFPELLPLEQQGYTNIGRSVLNVASFSASESLPTINKPDHHEFPKIRSQDCITILKNQQLETLLKELQEVIAKQQDEINSLRHALAVKVNTDSSPKSPKKSVSGNSNYSDYELRSSKLDYLRKQSSPSLSSSSNKSRSKLPLPADLILEEDKYSVGSISTDKTTTLRPFFNPKHEMFTSSNHKAFKSIPNSVLDDRDKFEQFLDNQSITDERKGEPESCPSPTKSMLLQQRDELEEELLQQYQRMRKLELLNEINI